MNSLQRWTIRLAARIAPPLRRALESSGGTIERLSDTLQMYRESEFVARANAASMKYELEEALSMAGPGPWQRGIQEATDKAPAAVKELARIKESYEVSQTEQLIALEDRGWQRLISQSQFEFSRYGIQQIILVCRLYKIKNALAGRGVAVSAHYVFGRGFQVSSPDDAANEVLQDFFTDPRNLKEVGHAAMVKAEEATWTDGNIFWVFFEDPQDGAQLVRKIDPIEIEEIICDPDDGSVPRFYHRRWCQQNFDIATGVITYKEQDCWYVDADYEPAMLPDLIKGKPLMRDPVTKEPIRIIHQKENGQDKWHFGLPRMFPSLPWMRAYRVVLENLCSVWAALARFAWQVETQGGAPAIANLKSTLATNLSASAGFSPENNPPPVTGAAFITGPGNKINPIKTGGMTLDPDQARRVLLMVCSAFGLGEHFFGDATTGSLATAASLDRPTELMFLATQERWREVLQRISHYVLMRSLRAPKSKLREAVSARGWNPNKVKIVPMVQVGQGTTNGIFFKVFEADNKQVAKTNDRIIVEVKFPSILEHDPVARVNAIVEAMTLNGFQPGQGIDTRQGVGLILQELGVEDVNAVLDAMFPEDEYKIKRDPPPPPPDPNALPMPGEPISGQPADPSKAGGLNKPHPHRISPKESVLVRAVTALEAAVAKINNGK